MSEQGSREKWHRRLAGRLRKITPEWANGLGGLLMGIAAMLPFVFQAGEVIAGPTVTLTETSGSTVTRTSTGTSTITVTGSASGSPAPSADGSGTTPIGPPDTAPGGREPVGAPEDRPSA
ncbi:hypothetical protein, partial [Actinosynnema sp.]|uniref:hypothetical protein n=1 Tax=Actinosynnema sp. TaxID=1872144 RepID=UPI003F828E19